MTKRNFYTILLTGLLCCDAGTAMAQAAVRASVDRSQILIGEPVRITLQADIPENQPIRFFRVDTIPHFEFLKKEKIDTANTGSGTVLSQVLHITSFDSGHWVVPRFVLYGDVATDTIGIDVGFSSFDTAQPYHDIRDIIDIAPEEQRKERRWWLAVGGALLLLLIVVWLSRKKKPVAAAVAVPPADPYQAALRQLEALQHKQLDAGAWYSELTGIFRTYIHDKKGIRSLQQTSDGLITQLRSLGMPPAEFDPLAQVLMLGDFVKFARYVPAAAENEVSRGVIKRSIDRIEQLQ
ncbi:MAG: hypothetical protein ABW019_15410 [Chitinophagaceae bacterium]